MAKKFEKLTKEMVYPIIAKYFKSGELASTFYKREGLSESQFYTWRSRYMKEHNIPSIVESAQAEPGFHPIQVSTPVASNKIPPSDSVSGQIELEYPNGVILRIETTLSDSRIASLVKLF